MKVLYCSAGGVGNVVMSTPAMRALAELGHEVTVFVKPREGEESARAAGLLRGWSALSKKEGEVVTGDAREVMRPGRFDLAVHSVWSFDRGFHADERTAGVFNPSEVHEAEANMIPVRELGYTGATPPTHVEGNRRCTQMNADTANGLLSLYLRSSASICGCFPGTYWALAPGCNPDPLWDRKRWGGWAALAGELRGLSVFLGASGDLPQRKARKDGTPPSPSSVANVVDLTGRTSLREAAAVIAGSRAFVGIDCGLAHVAAALGVPTVVLFGATSEVKNRPLGPRVRLVTLDLPCRPCQMTPAWDECVVWRCMAFDPHDVANAARAVARAWTRRESFVPCVCALEGTGESGHLNPSSPVHAHLPPSSQARGSLTPKVSDKLCLCPKAGRTTSRRA